MNLLKNDHSRIVIAFAIGLSLATLATFGQVRFPAFAAILWPGMFGSLALAVLFHFGYFDHPQLITVSDIFFDGCLYALLLLFAGWIFRNVFARRR